MVDRKKKFSKDDQKRRLDTDEDQYSSIGIPDTGAFHADPDVLIPDEAVDDMDIEIVLENLSPEEIAREVGKYTEDEDVQDDFADRQQLNTGGANLLRRLEQYNQVSPNLSAGDVDADWESTNENGDEGFSGTNPTPDQDVVDYEGLAAGISYGLEEELDFDKVNERDRKRWELDPRSADDENQAEDAPHLYIESDDEEDE